MKQLDEALEALERLTLYAAEETPNTDECLRDSEIVRQALERQSSFQWHTMDNVPRNKRLLLLFPPYVVCSGLERYGRQDEPQSDEFAWRCDCCGRFSTPRGWMLIPENEDE